MKVSLYLVLLFFILGCTKQQVIDTGVSSAKFDGTILQYLRSDTFNWQLTVELIEHAELTTLFEGNDPSYPQITFLGFTSLSVERFLFDSQFKDSSQGKFLTVRDIPKDLAREMILRHVIAGAFTRNDVAFKDKNVGIADPAQTGGTSYQAIAGNQVRAFRETTDYAGIPDAGAVLLRFYSITRSRAIPVASPDIQPNNGVVHALNYSYEFPII